MSRTSRGWHASTSTDDELDRLAGQLDVILASVARVSEVAADDIPPTSHALPLTNVFRDDVVAPGPDPGRGPRPVRPCRRGATASGSRASSTRRRDEPMNSCARTAAELAASRRRRDRVCGGGHARPTWTAIGAVDARRARVPARRLRRRPRGGRARSTQRRAAGEPLGALAGVPLALKDVLCMKGIPTTCGSRDPRGLAPAVRRHRHQPAQGRGRRHPGQDQHGRVRDGLLHRALGVRPDAQPVGPRRASPAARGGGSAAAVASFQAPLAIGTDTGGSIRQPAAVTGTVGVKPTYGGVSRYGLVALASSLDQAGPCARTVLDAALLHEVIGGHDPRDSTSINQPLPALVDAARSPRRAWPAHRAGQAARRRGLPAGCGAALPASPLDLLAGLGADIEEVDCPSFDYALAAYYLILPSEASSNLAKFDGMRYGLRVGDDGERSAEEVMALTRDAGFGDEVKRRIILGTYALSSGYYDAYYGQAQKVRTLIQRDFAAAFERVDVLVSPTCPTTAFPLGDKLDDPLAMYLNDVATIPVNLAGNCGLSLPAGLAAGGRPAGGLPDHGASAGRRPPLSGRRCAGGSPARRGGARPLLDRAPELAVSA